MWTGNGLTHAENGNVTRKFTVVNAGANDATKGAPYIYSLWNAGVMHFD